MKDRNINIAEVSEITHAINHYYQLGSYFPDLKRNNLLEDEFINYLINKKADIDYWKSSIVSFWNDIDFHFINQGWGSTSCGWGGIGGAAMSSKFNMVIENKYNNLFFVYWDGELAYIGIKDHDTIIDYTKLPSINNCEKKLNIIYKSKK